MANVMPRVMEIVTPLGDGVLLFHTMSAREEMSRLFEYHLDLLSAKPDINLDEILGKNVTIKLGLPDDETRHFNGFVTRFAQGGMHGRYHRYVATVRPWLWFLTRTSDCRIFQEMTVPDIIKAVFADHPSAELKLELTSNYRKWTYCVQYRETDFNFVSRLMEQEGIAYYFRHTEGHNTLVLTDSTSKHTPAAGCKALSYIDPHDVVREDHEHVSSWDYSREIQPGVYVHDDYDLERPSVELKASKTLPRKYKPSDYEVYDWPGEYVEKPHGEQYAAVRIDELGSQFEIARATTNSRALTVGSLLNLEDHPRPDQNREYLVLGAAYEMTFGDYEALPEQTGSSYKCSFLAMPSGQQFRPQRQTPKPFVQGPQTAVVVGPAGEEIYTDKYGRVKVQFHWDRRGKKDDKSSCWIRVSHPWAGKNWGGISNPRIGQEVIVDFLEGDPDQPIITGRVYNAEQMPPYDLPANQTQSGMKSRSSKGGGPANFNEIRMEDKMGSEQLFIHAEKNQDIEVENDETHWVGHDRKKTIDHDETTLVKHDRTETVDNDETITIHGNRTELVDKNETLAVKGNRRERIYLDHQEKIDGNMEVDIKRNLTETVVMNYSETVGIAMELTVGGLMAMTVGAALTEVVGLQKTETIGRSKSETIGADKSVEIAKNLTESVGKDQKTTVTENLTENIGGQHKETVKKEYVLQAKKIQLVADDEITIKTGSAEILMKKNGDITIKGGKVNVKASSDIILKGSTIKEN
jgi:type VI secretion system secreted protein VgrG